MDVGQTLILMSQLIVTAQHRQHWDIAKVYNIREMHQEHHKHMATHYQNNTFPPITLMTPIKKNTPLASTLQQLLILLHFIIIIIIIVVVVIHRGQGSRNRYVNLGN